ncbi:hypothetical protein TNCV_207511 [Trichonephila clavipes]|nr:hypothetical protein TNCV_207511 [Trichonephila clavipes]
MVPHYPVEVWLWPSPEYKEGQLAPTPQRYSAGCLKYRQCVLECKSVIQYRPYHNTRCRANVVVHNAAVQHSLTTVFPDSNPTIVVLQTDAGLVSRQLHSILPPTSFFHCTIGSGDVRGSESRVDQAMDVLPTDHFAVNGVEWYAQTLNDALKTQCAVLCFVMWLSDPSLQCAQFTCPHVKWCTEVDVIDHVGPSHPPASNSHISALQLFGFVQHDYRFS